MLKVIKPGQIVQSEDVVKIPDADTVPGQAMELSQFVGGDSGRLKQIYEEMKEQAKQEGKKLSDALILRANMERDEILNQARREAEEIRAQALQEGYADGSRQRSGEIGAAISQVQQNLVKMAEDQNAFMEDCSKNLMILAADIAGKILQKKIDEDDLVLVEMVKKAVSTIKDADWVSIEVSGQTLELVECLRREFAEHGGEYSVARIEVRPSSQQPGSCVIQTEDRVIDASVSTQLENLLHIFQEMD